MVTKQHYSTPDLYWEERAVASILCESTENEDYVVIDDFEW
jgi:hypothetical protein